MASRPNVLWLMTDEQRCDSMGCYGSPWARTPKLDRLAAEGTLFQNAYTTSPVCISARLSLLTGRAPSSLGVLNNHHWFKGDDPQFLTWEFARAGYQVANFGKVHYSAPRQAFDVEGGCVLGERVDYCAYKVPVDPVQMNVVRYDGGKTQWLFAGRFPGKLEDTPEMLNVEAALKWLKRRDPQRPFFLRVSFNAPHTPVVTPEPFDTLIDPDKIDLPIDFPSSLADVSAVDREFLIEYAGIQRLTPAQVRRARQCYYGHVTFVDHAFGVLLEAMAKAGELDNTIVAYCPDHGCQLGEHGFMQKQAFYEPTARVPFFFWRPQSAKSQVVNTPIGISSLLPTLLEMAGLAVPRRAEYPSLAGVLAGAPATAAPVFSEIDYGLHQYRSGHRRVMIRDGRWKLLAFRDLRAPARFSGSEDLQLYDLQRDPNERTNLAQSQPEVIAALTARIDAWDRSRTPVIQ